MEEDGADVSDGKIETFAELEAAVEKGREYTLLDDIWLQEDFTLSGVTLKNGTEDDVWIRTSGHTLEMEEGVTLDGVTYTDSKEIRAPHHFVDGVCAYCGAKQPTGTVDGNGSSNSGNSGGSAGDTSGSGAQRPDDSNPNTGDTGAASLVLCLMVLGVSGTALLMRRKRS